MHHIKELSLEERRAIGTVLQLADDQGWGELCGMWDFPVTHTHYAPYGYYVWVLADGKQYAIPYTSSLNWVWYDGTRASSHPTWTESLIEFLMR